MREKQRRRLPVCFDNEVDITDELSPLSAVLHVDSADDNTDVSTGEIIDMDITDMNTNDLPIREQNPIRRMSLPVPKVYIKNCSVHTSIETVDVKSRRDSVCISEKSWNSFESTSTSSSQSCPDLMPSTNLLELIVDNNNSIIESYSNQLENSTIFSDNDSIWDEDDQAKFHVKFFNRYGRKGKKDEELQNATHICHVYHDAVLVTDMLNNKLMIFARSGRPRKYFITAESSEPWAAVVTPRGYIAVTLRRQNCVALCSARGDTMFQFGHEILKCPTGIAIDTSGLFIVTDELVNDVFIFSPGGHCIKSLGGGFKQPRYVCATNSGRILVSDSGNHCIKVFDKDGSFLYKFGSYGSGNGQMKFPYGICVDQDENVFVADHYNDRITLFSIKGVFVQHIVTSSKGIRRPKGISVRCSHNRKLYITNGGLRATEVVVYKLIEMNSRYEVHVKCEV